MHRLILIAILFFISTTGSAHAGNPPVGKPSHSNQLILNGEMIAGEISKVTGIAISPILGISILGAYTYYTTPVEKRAEAPWHASPTFWGPLLAVLLGIIMKDSSKIGLPKIIIMPLDAIETLLEKNVSAVLGLLVILSSITGRGIEQLHLTGLDTRLTFLSSAYAASGATDTAATMSPGPFELGILSVLITAVFGLVWIVSQSFNFLMFLCPFSWLDLLLALCKNAIIAFLLGAYLINPFLGLLVSGAIILISLFLFARSYRFVIFGTIFSSDILLKKTRNALEAGPVKAFAGSFTTGVPSLSYGTLSSQDSQLVFHYRPWLFMPQKSTTAPFRSEHCDIGKGNLSPVIITTGKKSKNNLTLFRLLPRYHSHKKRVAELLGLKGVRDVTFEKSIKDGYRWLMEQLGILSKKEQKAA